MDEMIAFCGIACHECGALIATENKDNEKRAEVAELWSKEYNVDIKPEDIQLVAQQAGVPLEQAEQALKDANGDLARAILSLK